MNTSRFVSLLLVVLLATVLGNVGCGGEDQQRCTVDSCSGHGNCDDSSGQPVCSCDSGYAGADCGSCASGYQDNDASGTCLPDCSTAGLECGAHGQCQDDSGRAQCVCASGYQGDDCADCAAGYQDNDADGTCLPDCQTAGLDCHNGSCDDAAGQARCLCQTGYAGDSCDSCATGYQDNDTNGTCLPDCQSAGLDCGSNGQCDDSTGSAHCQCQPGYAAPDCAGCAAGYQDNDGDGSCLPDCLSAGLNCHGHGACDDTSGQAVCSCQPAYSGDDCTLCSNGYQDNDGDGSCLPDCQSAGLDCGNHGGCDDSGGAALCLCESGYAGAACESCASGYQDHDGDGICLPDCQTANLGCVHGQCQDSSGQAQCLCETGYSGDDCSQCAIGYQDNDGDGICSHDCSTAGLSCSSHGHCEDASGTAACACDQGYAGTLCETCASGYQDNDGNGTCHPDCQTANPGCLHGQCQDASGQAACVCDTGYAGDVCDSCAPGYQDNDNDGECTAGCPLSGLDCGTYGTCDDSSGTPLCVCQTGYTGSDCRQCDAGYQDNDNNGTCHPDCQLAAPACVHGSCSDASGQALCVCQDTWDGPLCDACAAGYQDNDGNDTCEPNCAGSGLSCGSHGHCDDTSGTAQCVCDTGYSGSDCLSCALGYQDNDNDGVCRPDCATAGYDASCAADGHGWCDDSSGLAHCVCDAGWFDDGQGHCLGATGADCTAPWPLPVANGTYQESTAGAGNDYTPSCASSSQAEETVYVIEVTQAVHMKFTSEGFDTVMYLRSDCEDPGSEIECDDDDGPGLGSMIDRDLQPGFYYLFIDGYGQAGGNYTLTVEVSCAAGQVWDPNGQQCVDDPCDPNPCTDANQTICQPVPPGYQCLCDPGFIDDPQNPGTCIPDPNPHGESCADVMPLDVVDPGSVTGSTVDATGDATGSCAGNGPDRVYGFTLSEPMRAEFAMSGYDTALHLRAVCDDPGSEVACDDDGGAGTSSLLGPLVLQPGTYYLWADSYSSGGDYTLDYSFRTNPCADEEAVCPGTPVCEPASDWSGYQCVCPAGTLPWGNDCIDDPCDPNPCSEPNRNRCEPDLPGAYNCLCNLGYIDDPQNPGTCIEDPNANEWAFLVYMNADNNLDPAGWDDLAEMQTAGSTPYVHIVVLMDTAGYSDDGHARKLYVTQGGYDVIEDMGEIDMGDWQTLRDFGVWAVQNFPARHYALVMWDHGSGWDRKKPLPPSYKGFSYDDSSGNHISVAGGDYQQALQGITAALGEKLDIIGHDECLMGMWEVALVSAPYGNYFVASEETEPFDGWAYDGFLPALVADPQNTSPLQLSVSIVDAYYNADSGNSTLSAVDLQTMDQLNATMNAFADALRAHPELNSQIDSVRGNTQSFYYSEYRDLKHFAMGIAGMSGAPAELVAAANALVAQLDVSIAHYRSQSDYPGAYGLSVYMPSRSSSPDAAYLNALWSQVSTWDEFLQGFNR